MSSWWSGTQFNNTNMPTHIDQDVTSYSSGVGTSADHSGNLNILSGGLGIQGSVSSSIGTLLKPITANTFGPQIIRFSGSKNVSHLKIEFGKFSPNISTSDTLYNFNGKEHMLVFKINSRITNMGEFRVPEAPSRESTLPQAFGGFH